jgi:hypothetical protein
MDRIISQPQTATKKKLIFLLPSSIVEIQLLILDILARAANLRTVAHGRWKTFRRCGGGKPPTEPMNPSKGIFGNAPESPDTEDSASSPFKTLATDGETTPKNPFSNAEQTESPFADGALDSTKTVRTPEPHPKPAHAASPFELADPEEEFGYDAPSDFGSTSPPPIPTADSPFATAPSKTEDTPAKPVEPKKSVAEAAKAPAPAPATVTEAHRPAAAPGPMPSYEQPEIRQLELRAIFGVDRELSADEILRRLRSLAGIRNVTRIDSETLAALNVLNRNLAGLVPEAAPMRVSFGGAPVEFIRSGRVCLAVINDGSFAPGTKETIIIAARELDRMP